jgi:hypothetical protein
MVNGFGDQFGLKPLLKFRACSLLGNGSATKYLMSLQAYLNHIKPISEKHRPKLNQLTKGKMGIPYIEASHVH